MYIYICLDLLFERYVVNKIKTMLLWTFLELSNKLLDKIVELSTDPKFVAKSVQNFISFQNCNQNSNYFLKQKVFLQKIISRLQNGEKIEELKFVGKKLISSENFSIQVFGDFENMSHPEILDPWKKLAPILNFSSKSCYLS